MIRHNLSLRPATSSDARSNRGRLRNGNPSGDYMKAPRCGAKTRTGRCSCRQPAMANGRCRFHGGKSTGARTAEGRARCAHARRTHGFYSAATVTLRREEAIIERLPTPQPSSRPPGSAVNPNAPPDDDGTTIAEHPATRE